MASIRKEIVIDTVPRTVWNAVRDIGALHMLAPGFVVDTRLVEGVEPEARIVTFANGMVVKEVIVDLCDARRRLAWTVQSDQVIHHNGSMQVFEHGEGQTRAVWIADVLPHALGATFDAMMEQGMAAMKRQLEPKAE
jgi:hypothetical protein